MNRVDHIDSPIGDETDRRIMASFVAERRNLRDRFAF
jgi:hypothetical protein